jgi:ferredoxin
VTAVRITIDRDVCVGSGNCAFWAPGVFDLDDEGTAVVLDPEAADAEHVQAAVRGCPTQAISVDG